MIFDSLRFAWSGPVLAVESEQSPADLSAKLKKHTYFQAFKKESSGMFVSIGRGRVSVAKLRNPFTAFGKPVFHGEFIPAGRGVRLSGKFSFAVWMQAKFWFLQIACTAGLVLGIYRVSKALFFGQPLMDLVAWALPAAIALGAWGVVMMIANDQVDRYRGDMDGIADFLRSVSGDSPQSEGALTQEDAPPTPNTSVSNNSVLGESESRD